MTEKNKVTFKKQPKMTGIAAIGYPYQSVDIKLNGKIFGIINSPNWQTIDNTWSVGIMVYKTEPDKNPNCDWKWLYFSKKFNTEDEAREFVESNIEEMNKKYKLRFEQ
jgi:hypothetical protein